MEIQQRPAQRRRQMESSIRDKIWIIRTNSHVFQTMQFASNISNNEERNLSRYDKERWIIIYMDNIFIFTKTIEENVECVKRILQ